MATIQMNGSKTFITPTGFKTGSKGKVIQPSTFYSNLPTKSERRKVRKFAYANGFKVHASAPTV